MKLHTNTEEKVGGKGKVHEGKKRWTMDVRIELSDEEQRLMEAEPQLKDMIIATGTFVGNYPEECSVGMLVDGLTGSAFDNLANQTKFEESVRQGCGELKGILDRLRDRLHEVSGGSKTVEF